MDAPTDTGNLLETVEASQDKVQDDRKVRHSRVESASTGELPKGDLEGGNDAVLRSHQERNSQPRSHLDGGLLLASTGKLKNRRIPSGTCGGVGGR